MRIALGVEYDGSGYRGWQSQRGGGTVQDTLEAALATLADAPVRVHCAGRTDTGVHALAQVVHFDTGAERPDSAWVRGTNARLPADISITWAARVNDDFHARFGARARRYCYLIFNRPVRPALLAGRVGWFHLPLDEARMAEAATALVGEHDFSAFRAAECQAKSPVRTLESITIERQGEIIAIHLTANAFLHHMVRNIVGALVYVGKGRHSPDWLGELLAGRDRRLAAPTFSAAGLYFAGVDYGPGWQLPAGGRIMVPHPWFREYP